MKTTDGRSCPRKGGRFPGLFTAFVENGNIPAISLSVGRNADYHGLDNRVSPIVPKTVVVPQDLQHWIEARKRHRLSHAHVQMARELGMNPRKLGKIDNHRQEPWKAPLPIFIESIYFKRFKKERPDRIMTVEEIAAAKAAGTRARKLAKQARKAGGASAERAPAPEDAAACGSGGPSGATAASS